MAQTVSQDYPYLQGYQNFRPGLLPFLSQQYSLFILSRSRHWLIYSFIGCMCVFFRSSQRDRPGCHPDQHHVPTPWTSAQWHLTHRWGRTHSHTDLNYVNEFRLPPWFLSRLWVWTQGPKEHGDPPYEA